MVVNLLHLAGDHLLAQVHRRPQEEAHNIPEEHVAPQVYFNLNFSTNEEFSQFMLAVILALIIFS